MDIKKFENYDRYSECLNIIKNSKEGDILSNDVIYNYVEYLNDKSNIHSYEDSFIEGDLGKRLDKYEYYKLVRIPIDYLDLDEWERYDDEIDEYQELYKETNYYPPIVISHKYSIIDGLHRANAIANSGENTILAFVGLKKTK